MGLLSIIRKASHREHQLRLLFLGLDNSGKSTILKRLLSSPDWDSLSPTLGFDIQSVQFGGYTLNIWDIGGQRTLRPYWKNYFERTDAVVWVVDSQDVHRLQECREELWSLIMDEDRLANASLLVLANKQDLPGALTLQGIAEQLKTRELLEARGGTCKVMQSSAVANTGIREALAWLVKDCEERLYWGNAMDRIQKQDEEAVGVEAALSASSTWSGGRGSDEDNDSLKGSMPVPT